MSVTPEQSQFDPRPEIDPKIPPIYLVSAELPGTGASSLTRSIEEALLAEGKNPELVSVGDRLREVLGIEKEDDFAEKLKEIPDPNIYDPEIYAGLPDDRPVIVDGKLATTVGPKFIDPRREVVCIDLVSLPMISAKRILNREGQGVETLFAGNIPDGRLLTHLTGINKRAEHDAEMREAVADDVSERANVVRNTFDSSHLLQHEIRAKLLTGENFETFVPEWEIEALKQVRGKLAHINALLESDMHPSDREHFRHQYEAIGYNIARLDVVLQPDGINKVREELKKSIIDCWFGLMMKKVPRFFDAVDAAPGEPELIFDTESRSWTPEYYKIAEGWPVLSEMLKGKTVLDPFAGTGAFLNLLVARDIPSRAFYADLAYEGGQPINGSGYRYAPKLNMHAAQLLFDELPSWYKPKFDEVVGGVITTDARALPFGDDSVDYICTDPPYGKNCESGGRGLFFKALGEMMRVAREGVIMMVPIEWLSDLDMHDLDYTQLTKDVSRGTSGLPVCYVKINKTNK